NRCDGKSVSWDSRLYRGGLLMGCRSQPLPDVSPPKVRAAFGSAGVAGGADLSRSPKGGQGIKPLPSDPPLRPAANGPIAAARPGETPPGGRAGSPHDFRRPFKKIIASDSHDGALRRAPRTGSAASGSSGHACFG